MVLRLIEVTKVFSQESGAVEALAPVSLDVRRGEFAVLVGQSGCGKSTLLNLIAGFESPTSGRILLDGQPVTKPGQDRLVMFQEHGLFPWLNVIENVTYGLQWKMRFQLRKRRQIARDLLRMVHLEEFEKASIHQLSGGMKQRVALARALAPDPKILLVDEPFPALDAMTRQKLYGDLDEIFTRTGKTIISVTHDTLEAVLLGDRVLIFSKRPGRVTHEIAIDLPRPRDPNDPRIGDYAAQIMAVLAKEHETT